jgi:hypothetical protein
MAKAAIRLGVAALSMGLTVLAAGSGWADPDGRSVRMAADSPISGRLFVRSPLKAAVQPVPVRLVELDSALASPMTATVREAVDGALRHTLEVRGLLAPGEPLARYELRPTIYDLSLEQEGMADTLRLAFGYVLVDRAGGSRRHFETVHARVPFRRPGRPGEAAQSEGDLLAGAFGGQGPIGGAADDAVRQVMNTLVADLLSYESAPAALAARKPGRGADPLKGLRLD